MTLAYSVTGLQGEDVAISPPLNMAQPATVAHLLVFLNQTANMSRQVTVAGGVERAEVPVYDSWGGGALAETTEPDSFYDGSLTFTMLNNKNVIMAAVDLGGATTFRAAATSGGASASNTWTIPAGFTPGDRCVVAFGANQSVTWGAVPAGWNLVVDYENLGTFAPRMRVLTRVLQAGDTTVTQTTSALANAVAVGGVWLVEPAQQPPPGPPAELGQYWADNPHAVTVRATLTPYTGPAVDLDLVAGSVVWDAGDTWRTLATLDVPFTLDTWQLVKDFSASKIRVVVGCVLPTTEVIDVPVSGPLVIRRAAVTRPEDRITLTLASEASLVDDLRFTADTPYPAGDGATKIQALVNAALPLATFDVQGNGPGLAAESNAGTSRWEAVEAVADYAALEVWQDTDSRFVIRAQPTQQSTPVDSLLVGSAGNIIESFSDFDRDTFANAYAVRSGWIDANGQTNYAYGIAYNTDPATGTQWDGPAGNKVRTDAMTVKLTDSEALQIAVRRLRRAIGHGRGVRVTVPLRPWLKPGDPISVELPTGGVQVHTVQRVAHDLAGLTTTIDTRLLPE